MICGLRDLRRSIATHIRIQKAVEGFDKNTKVDNGWMNSRLGDDVVTLCILVAPCCRLITALELTAVRQNQAAQWLRHHVSAAFLGKYWNPQFPMRVFPYLFLQDNCDAGVCTRRHRIPPHLDQIVWNFSRWRHRIRGTPLSKHHSIGCQNGVNSASLPAEWIPESSKQLRESIEAV